MLLPHSKSKISRRYREKVEQQAYKHVRKVCQQRLLFDEYIKTNMFEVKMHALYGVQHLLRSKDFSGTRYEASIYR